MSVRGVLVVMLATLGSCQPSIIESSSPGPDGATSLPDAPSGSGPDSPVPDALMSAAIDAGSGCPTGMAQVATYCVDRYEAYVVEVDSNGNETPHSPYDVIAAGTTIRAKVAPGVVPQAYISQVQASAACANAGKRLCTADEFSLACRGPDSSNWYPYGGETHEAGYCNEGKGSSMPMFYGNDPSTWTYADFNDPRLDMWPGGLATGGTYSRCVSPYGIYDLVGNLHEWGADAADANGHGRFRGGFYGDAEENGPGCLYVTSAHELTYHDYSTGFRCCADPR
jgi:hypothetical protein